ncbi:MAG: hypothetical protein HS126_19300 [Anaerolineales bacterium]|nr:hypothetical protein [Anaerolineales bacterium]
MGQEALSHDLSFPKWQWSFDRWEFILGTVLSIALPFIFNPSASLLVNLIFVAGCVIITIILTPTFIWLLNRIKVSYRRIAYYPQLRENARQMVTSLEQASEQNSKLIQYILSQSPLFEIRRVFRENERIFLVLAKKRGSKLEVGDKLEVVDSEDYKPLGSCEVLEVRTDGYYTLATHLDALWKGYIMSQNALEMPVSPYKVAVKIKPSQN